MLGSKRSQVEILRDVLALVEQGERKSRLMALAGLSHDMVNRYVGWLMERGYVSEGPSGGFVVTSRGHVLQADLDRVIRHFRDEPAPESDAAAAPLTASAERGR